MSMYAGRFMLSANPYGLGPQKPGRKAWFNVEFINLVRPECYWPQPLSLEQAFEVFRWLVRTGDGYASPTRWGCVGTKALLSATSANDDCSVSQVESIADLRTRFHYAILGVARSEAIAKWRSDHGVGPAGKVRISVPTYRPFVGARHLGWDSERAIIDTFERLTLKCRGQRMAVPLNYIHLGSRYLHRVSVAVRPENFSFILTFGDEPCAERGACSWNETIASTRPGETFLDTFARARDVFEVLVTGARTPCDAADLLESCWYHPQWHREYLDAFASGDRSEISPPHHGTRVATETLGPAMEGGR
jgi:hypothetical protein